MFLTLVNMSLDSFMFATCNYASCLLLIVIFVYCVLLLLMPWAVF